MKFFTFIGEMTSFILFITMGLLAMLGFLSLILTIGIFLACEILTGTFSLLITCILLAGAFICFKRFVKYP
jgi:hypothetical protein